MKILVSGASGYIGSVLTPLLHPHEVIGIDAGFYSDTPGRDIRDLVAADFVGIDAVIHLAALSNDPLGEINTSLTYQINSGQSLRLACLAKDAGVKRFVFISSQSVYGTAADDVVVTEATIPNPLTAYGRSKWEAECGIAPLNDARFSVVILRPATVFGWSPNLRTDLVLNEFVLSAMRTGTITIRSDGTPWRPLIHVKDLCETIVASLDCCGPGTYNVGLPTCYTVLDLAEMVREQGRASIVITGERTDGRSYRVDCSRGQSLWKPQFSVEYGIQQLQLLGMNPTHPGFPYGNRLARLRSLLDSGSLTPELRWKV